MLTNRKMLPEQGFTLIEMALVIIIGGVMLSLLGSALISFQKKSQIRTTEYRIATISEALERYLSINDRYPCPANRTATPDDADFGRTGNTNNCQNAATGVVDVGTVKIGAVPTRTLNLPDEHAADAWGRKFTYAVTELLATSGSYTPNGGTITVNDLNGNPTINPAGSAHYIITSHGATGMGGFVFNGTTQYTTCSATFGRDEENCDNNATFISSLVTSEATGVNFYDDYLYARGQVKPSETVPPGAVMAFASPNCPAGWAEYTALRGRVIVGATTTAVNLPRVANTDAPSGTISYTASIEQSGSHDFPASVPSHVALLYCRKD